MSRALSTLGLEGVEALHAQLERVLFDERHDRRAVPLLEVGHDVLRAIERVLRARVGSVFEDAEGETLRIVGELRARRARQAPESVANLVDLALIDRLGIRRLPIE